MSSDFFLKSYIFFNHLKISIKETEIETSIEQYKSNWEYLLIIIIIIIIM